MALTKSDLSQVETLIERVVIKHIQPLRDEIETLARITARGFARIEERLNVLEHRVDRLEEISRRY